MIVLLRTMAPTSHKGGGVSIRVWDSSKELQERKVSFGLVRRNLEDAIKLCMALIIGTIGRVRT